MGTSCLTYTWLLFSPPVQVFSVSSEYETKEPKVVVKGFGFSVSTLEPLSTLIEDVLRSRDESLGKRRRDACRGRVKMGICKLPQL